MGEEAVNTNHLVAKKKKKLNLSHCSGVGGVRQVSNCEWVPDFSVFMWLNRTCLPG